MLRYNYIRFIIMSKLLCNINPYHPFTRANNRQPMEYGVTPSRITLFTILLRINVHTVVAVKQWCCDTALFYV